MLGSIIGKYKNKIGYYANKEQGQKSKDLKFIKVKNKMKILNILTH